VLEPSARGVAEVERQVLDDEEVVGHFPGMACEPLILEPYAGVGILVVSWYIGRSPEARRKRRGCSGQKHVVDGVFWYTKHVAYTLVWI
jgi:hypothetical protein